jgi:hypothetical protein
MASSETIDQATAGPQGCAHRPLGRLSPLAGLIAYAARDLGVLRSPCVG